jgi:hypothetical protein
LEITNSINVIVLTWQQVIAGKFVSSKIYRSVNGVDFDSVETTSSGSLTDTTVVLGTRYYYYVTTVFNQWESNPSDTVEALVEAVTSLKDQTKFPNTYQLKQNYPNPFNPKTMINYQLPITNYVELSIYNLLGQKVATLVNERQQAGYHQIEWDAGRYSSGVYYYRMVAGDFHDVKKMILVR